MLSRFPKILLAAAGSILWPAWSAWACSVCFGGNHDGYNASVLFLMAAPYLVFGSIVGGLFFAYRRAKRRDAAAAEEPQIQLIWREEESGR